MRTKYYGNGFIDAGTVLTDTDKINPKKKLIDKVTKLFAVADSTIHEGEANNARNLAVELLAKHNLSLNQVNVDEQNHTHMSSNKGIRSFNYDTQLHHTLAKFTGVFFFIQKEKKTTIFNYVGTIPNLQAFHYMVKIVLQQREHAQNFANSSDIFAWKNGFAEGVRDKCRKLHEQMKQKVEGEGLMVVDESKSAQNSLSGTHQFVKGKKGSQRITTAGFNAGRNVNLNKGVSTTDSTLLIE